MRQTLAGAHRVAVAFEGNERAWVLLVGIHRDDDPQRNFYDELYRLADARPPSDQRRRKPPCCDDADRPPAIDEPTIAGLADRARALLRDDTRRARSQRQARPRRAQSAVRLKS